MQKTKEIVVINGKRYICTGGNELVEMASKGLTEDELYGSGYLSQLSDFIKRRDAAIEEEARLKEERRNKRKSVVALEPGLE